MLYRILPAVLAFWLLSACGPVLVADDARKRELIMRQHADVWTRGNLDAIDQLYTEDFVGHFHGTLVEGRRSLRAYVESQRDLHPDWRESVQWVIVEGSRGASQAMLEGGAVAALLDIDDARVRLALEQASLFEFERGRIARQWVYPDPTRPKQALGLQPAR